MRQAKAALIALVLVGCGSSAGSDGDAPAGGSGGSASAAGSAGQSDAGAPTAAGTSAGGSMSASAGTGGSQVTPTSGTGGSAPYCGPAGCNTGGKSTAGNGGSSAGTGGAALAGATGSDAGAGGEGGAAPACTETDYPTCNASCPMTFRACDGMLPVWVGPNGVEYPCGPPLSPGDGPNCAAEYAAVKKAKDACCAAQ